MVKISEEMSGYRIEWIELDNFKSYAGQCRIGPFRAEGVNAIIGPNGSGKSNLMDAISFVCGSKKNIRVDNMKELVHSGSKEGKSARRASVKAMLVKDGEGEDTQILLERSISGSTSTYRINGKNVSWESYKNKFQKVNNNFVFQGEVDGIAARRPRDLTKLFEEASGSYRLKESYDELLEKKKHADERMQMCFSKKKGVAAEKRDIRAQKEEAEAFQRKEKKLRDLKEELYLYKLYVPGQKFFKAVEETEAIVSVLKKKTEEASEIEQLVSNSRMESGKLQRESMKANKAYAKLKKDAERGGASVALKHVEGEINQVIKRLRRNEAKLKEVKEQHQNHLNEIQNLNNELAAKEAELHEFEAGVAKQSGHGQADTLQGALMDEYAALKAEAGKRSVILQQEKDAIERRRTAEADSLLTLEGEVKELNRRLQQLQVETEELTRSESGKSEQINDLQKELRTQEKEKKHLSQIHKKNTARRDHLNSKMEDMEGQMREAKSYKKEKERDARMLSAIGNLKDSVKGVHGRLSELCKISESRYNLAITVALGKNMDAVIVEDVEAAKECIQWLKNHFLPPMMFLPIQTIKAKQIKEKNRYLGGTSKLAYDIVQFDPQYERVVRFVCGNTLVCESHSEAKALAFGEQRHKVVTLDGTLIDRSGTITGGRSQGIERLVQRWNDAHLQSVKKSFESMASELRQLPSLNQMLAHEQENQKALEGLQQKLHFLQAEQKVVEKKKSNINGEVASLEKKKQSQIPILDDYRKDLETLTGEIDGVDSKLHAITDTVFSEFSKKVGVQNIREYEEKHLKEQQEFTEKRLLLNTELSKVKSQLEYEMERETAGPLEKAERSVTSDSNKLEKLKSKEVELGSKAKTEKANLAKQEGEAKRLQQMYQEANDTAKASKVQYLDVTKNIKDLTRKKEAKDNQVEQLKNECEDVVQAALMDQMELPVSLKPSDDTGDCLELNGKVYSFENLDKSMKSLSSDQQQENLENNLKDDIQKLQVELEKENPNLKAAEQYDKALEQEKEVGQELDKARAECESISVEFEELKTQRCEAFMKTFDAVASSIDKIYKELTGGLGHEDNIGGTAYLSLENPDEPFLAGVKYTAMPPTKRFRDMTDLSGGEKTVAALALLFALNLSSPGRAEFFVLDEIDAALDSTNVVRVAHFLKHRKMEFQTIVISLKDTFYDKADTLHGVCRNPESGFSQTFSLDLSQFA